MAERLYRSNYFDGAVFHGYHAFECVVSAFIAARGVRVPPNHRERIIRFTQNIDHTQPYATEYVNLDFLTLAVRNQSLYYDEATNVMPPDRYDAIFTDYLLSAIDRFARAVWRELRARPA